MRVLFDALALLFRLLYEALLSLRSRRWPTTEGEITAVDLESTDRGLEVAVAYKFSIGEDGPYCGEAFWQSPFSFSQKDTMRKVRRAVHVRQRVQVRYRPDDPEVNVLEGGVGRLLKKRSKSPKGATA